MIKNIPFVFRVYLLIVVTLLITLFFQYNRKYLGQLESIQTSVEVAKDAAEDAKDAAEDAKDAAEDAKDAAENT